MAFDTSERILDVAEHLVQTRGFNGFSYADIAKALEVTKASLHYHFPAKADLGARLIERYEHNFAAGLDAIDQKASRPRDKLHRYVAIYEGVLKQGRMCLCGMLAAEFGTLPEGMRTEMRRFFDANERWIAGVLQQGKKEKTLKFSGSAVDAARALIDTLEGAMMIARTYGAPGRFHSVSERALKELGA
jgi:TetR/AcrR family transcriptional repressor of nem operon